MMAAQLLGTGGVAILLLAAVATGVQSIVDVALLLALLAAFAAVAFVRDLPASSSSIAEPTERS
jgi:multicomponent Na+:H+ antiporter subunit F